MAVSTAHALPAFKNQAIGDNFKSVQVYPSGNPLGYPIVALGSGESLEFHFDEMTTDLNNYQFAALHCTHDWELSDIDAMEYLQGFPTQSITNYEASFNTQVEYVHHRFNFPNDMMRPKYSGNYLIVVFNGNNVEDQSSWLITYRIMVYEQVVKTTTTVAGTNLIADRYKKQDVDLNINYTGVQVIDPMLDIHVAILQNMEWSSAIANLTPQYVQNNNLVYDYNMGENAFLGGAEYRNFEMKSLLYSSLQVEHIQREDDGYHAYLRQDYPLGSKAYSTQIDINGNYLVKNDVASDSHLEGEYVWVHFALEMKKMEEQTFYVYGRFNQFDSTPIVMSYNDELGAYTCKALLKQGYYNYRYGSVNNYNGENSIGYTEGNFSSTENDYHVIVYLYDRVKGCDRIVDIKLDNSVR